MAVLKARFFRAFLMTGFLLAALYLPADTEKTDPVFDRDTVLVWKIQTTNYDANFIARIASFSPDRFIEWEDGRNQGTVLLSRRAIADAGGYDNSRLFVAGMEKKSNRTTALWLSEKTFIELKEKKKVRIYVDGVQTKLSYIADERIPVEINRVTQELPVIKLQDDRGMEWSFWDRKDNPLLIRQSTRNFTQTLVSITTDRPNTLRWIKGRKISY